MAPRCSPISWEAAPSRRKRTAHSAGCAADLAGAQEASIIRRQVTEIPPVTAEVTEHQMIGRLCGVIWARQAIDALLDLKQAAEAARAAGHAAIDAEVLDKHGTWFRDAADAGIAQPAAELRLLGRLPIVFSGEHSFALTRSTQITYRGLVVPFIGKTIAATQIEFNEVNQALKRRLPERARNLSSYVARRSCSCRRRRPRTIIPHMEFSRHDSAWAVNP